MPGRAGGRPCPSSRPCSRPRKRQGQHDPDNKILNGRQIRNAFQTALAIALYEPKGQVREDARTQGKSFKELEGKKAYRSAKLLKRHFEEVDGAVQQYFKYLRDLEGLDPDEKAHQQHILTVDADDSATAKVERATRRVEVNGDARRSVTGKKAVGASTTKRTKQPLPLPKEEPG